MKLKAALVGVIFSIATGAIAQPSKVSNDVVKIGVLTDMTGLFSDMTGSGSLEAVRMAVADFGGKVLDRPIEIVYADHQNKVDIASNAARQWIDVQNVDMMISFSGSATGLAAVEIAKSKNRIAMVTGATSTRFSNENCTNNSVHYGFDTYSMSNGTARQLLKAGYDTWYFITADYAFGYSLQQDATNVIEQEKGKVLGSVKHPLNSSDLSAYLLQAQASKAKVIALANAGGDTINSIRQAKEFGIGTGANPQKLAALVLFISDVHSLGLPIAQGIQLTTPFYWDTNDQTRAWSRRFFSKQKKMPTDYQAGDYSATMHYLKAVQAAGTDEPAAVMAKMKALPVNDFYARNGRIREDGLLVHDLLLAEVKKPSESKYPWDYYTIKAVIPGSEAFQPLSKSRCPLVIK